MKACLRVCLRVCLPFSALLLLSTCKKEPTISPAVQEAPQPPKSLTVGLVTDVGGRGDQSFNDSALRGLERGRQPGRPRDCPRCQERKASYD